MTPRRPMMIAPAILCAIAGVASAGRTIVVAPLTSLSAEATSESAKKIQADLEKAVAAMPDTTVITGKDAAAAIKKAKRPELRVCENDAACLSELGKLVGADLVVAGEAGGLGDVQVVYLELVDAQKGKSVRSTTLEAGDETAGGAAGAIYRLLDPDHYTGTMTLAVDAAGASIYVDGKKLGKSPSMPFTLTVGQHALRVTHPDYRDFVRFVDVGFHADQRIEVKLQEFPIVGTTIQGNPLGPTSNITYVDTPTPWYRKWWAIAGFSGVLVIGAGVTAGIIADGVHADTVRPVPPGAQ